MLEYYTAIKKNEAPPHVRMCNKYILFCEKMKTQNNVYSLLLSTFFKKLEGNYIYMYSSI